jgi:uncharacterized protein (TIGR00255 family)
MPRRKLQILSMTGYGESHGTIMDHEVDVEILTLNSRFLDIFLSLPEFLERYELLIRRRISEVINRGRVRVRIKVAPVEEKTGFEINRVFFNNLVKEVEEWSKGVNFPVMVDIGGFFRTPGVIKVVEREVDREKFLGELLPLVDGALQAVVESRRREGEKIGEDIMGRLRELKKILRRIKPLKEAEIEAEKEKLQNVSQIVGDIPINSEEILSASIKVDASEEISRMFSHISTFERILKGKEPLKGRKLEFLAQELHREATTLSQKSLSPEIITLTVEMREEIERIREQLRNIE